MNSSKRSKNIFTIPSGTGFPTALAQQILAETGGQPETLSRYRILLPTRRACRILREAFLQQNEGKALLLPRMQPLGDIEEEELSLSYYAPDILDLPPAMPPLKRQALLARAIARLPHYKERPAQALRLAGTLGGLMDQIIIEGLDISTLKNLVPGDLAAHWNITLEFLGILTAQWPEILKENGQIDEADRRNRLIRSLAGQWRIQPPDYPVIAAGSTGSIPATWELLDVIAGMEQGRVVLPGLDQDMDNESWKAAGETHPQYGLKTLLGHLGVERENVLPWARTEETPAEETRARHFLLRELMRPAETSTKWQALATSKAARNMAKAAIKNLALYTCAHEREEAQIIALALRETLETPQRTAALVTPDRALARRVAGICQRWGIALDDSAGVTLRDTPQGVFLRLCLEAAMADNSAGPVFGLLRHESCCACGQNVPFRKTVDKAEVMLRRNLNPAPGLTGIIHILQQDKNSDPLALLRRIEAQLQPLLVLAQQKQRVPFAEIVDKHMQAAEALNLDGAASDSAPLWSGENGEALSSFMTRLAEQAHHLPQVTLRDYAAMLTHLMANETIRPAYGTHPRLRILGQLEARMSDADLLILASLNEGTWPSDAGFDPWMSRPMRKEFGLPALERGTGQSAHDFQQAFCAPKIILTRSSRVQGAPAVPSRWLQRLDTVLKGCGLGDASLRGATDYLALARSLDHHAGTKPCRRPEPRPPVDKRPATVSVTRVEAWLRDPYAIYARYVLGLRKLDPLDRGMDNAARGTALHKILERFAEAYPGDIPPDAEEKLQAIAKDVLSENFADPALWRFWWPRFIRLSEKFIEKEREWRRSCRPAALEAEGNLPIAVNGKNFALSGKADRIDKTQDGHAVVIDYKSGGQHRASEIASGKKPQLPLEAAMVAGGAFESLGTLPVRALSYWVLGGGAQPAEFVSYEAGDGADLSALGQNALEGLSGLFAAYDDADIPYYSLPNPENTPDYNDYEHLARVREWTVLGDSTEEAA